MDSNIPDNLLTQRLPSEYTPGGDRISRMATRSDILYMPALSALGSLPPLLIEVQNTIDSQFMRRLIGYSLKVVKTHKTLPAILSPNNLLLEFTPSSDQKPWLFSFPCTMWAKNCYLVSKETISGQDFDSPLSPLLALSLFLAEQQPSLYLHTHPHDPTIIQLYETALALVSDDQVVEENFFSSIETICDTNEQLFKRAIDKISSRMSMDRIKRICERGIEYNREVKHRLVDDSGSTSSQEVEYPDSLQLGPPPRKKSAHHTMSNQDFEFVQHFKNNSAGRMNWKLCLQMGQNHNLLGSFTTSESLRVSYAFISQKNKHINDTV